MPGFFALGDGVDLISRCARQWAVMTLSDPSASILQQFYRLRQQ
jgi:hypothetical protein